MKSVERERERQAEGYVFLIDLANYLGRTLTSLSEKSRRAGIPVFKIRRPVSGKASLAVRPEDAKRLKSMDTPRAEIIRPEDLFKS